MITGAARGLGFCIARGLAEAGAAVVLNDILQAELEKSVSLLQHTGLKAAGFRFDVTEYDQVEAQMQRIEEQVGPVDVLINNAGIHKREPLVQMSPDNWRKVVDVNLTSAFIVGQCAAKRMIKRRQGKIINITSINAEMARPSIANYCAAKGGLKMLTKSMALEWGPYNITANAIGPGYFITELTRTLAADPDFDAWVKGEVPLGRWGEPEDLIGTAVFLSSAASDYVNGQTLYVDGGWQAGL